MFKLLFTFFVLAGTGLATASMPCSGILGEDAHQPLTVANGILCFKLQPVLDKEGFPLLDEEKQIYVFLIYKDQQAIKIQELPYLATTGKVEDAFQLDVNQDGKEDVVVIHSAEITSYTGTCKASPWYSILILKQTESNFEYDERASNWFGNGGDLCEGDIGKIIYVFPFKTKETIIKALMSSSLRSFLVNDVPRFALLNRKSWLYDAAVGGVRTKKYLIAGDKVRVDGVQANMCQITYTGGKKPLQMWLLCDALKLDSTNLK
jgi:hypothetical protein